MLRLPNKPELMGAFLQGASISDIARATFLSRVRIESVIREGTLQALQQLAAQPDFPPLSSECPN